MKYKELIKRSDGDQLFVAGHFSKEEINEYIKQGYRINITQFNKYGMRVINNEQ